MKTIFVNDKAMPVKPAVRKAKITLILTDCSKCPYVKEKGCRAQYSDYSCSATDNRVIESYAERPPNVPDWCPFIEDDSEAVRCALRLLGKYHRRWSDK